MDQDNDKNNEQPITKQVRIKWASAEGVPTIYANQLLVTHFGKEFYLVFGETSVPMFTGMPGEEPPDVLEIKPVIKIAIAPEMMPLFLDVLNRNVSRYLERLESSEDQE